MTDGSAFSHGNISTYPAPNVDASKEAWRVYEEVAEIFYAALERLDPSEQPNWESLSDGERQLYTAAVADVFHHPLILSRGIGLTNYHMIGWRWVRLEQSDLDNENR